MRGLILKDIINLKKNIKMFSGLIVLYVAMSTMMDGRSFFNTVLTMIVAILTLSLYSYDELAKWDVYALTMPVRKEEVVQGKYIMMLLLTVIGMIISSVFTLFLYAYQKTGSLFDDFKTIGASAAIVILFYCIIIPFVTKLGVEKARLIFFVVYMIPFLVTVGLSKLIDNGSLVIPEKLLEISQFFLRYAYIAIPALLLVALGISYLISIRLYRKREF